MRDAHDGSVTSVVVPGATPKLIHEARRIELENLLKRLKMPKLPGVCLVASTSFGDYDAAFWLRLIHQDLISMVVLNRSLIGTLVIVLFANGVDAQELSVTTTENTVLVAEADRPVLVYQRATKSLDGLMPRAGYVHPLYGLDGQELTEDFPSDHRHHRGVFWAWHQVWVGDQQLGDPWLCKDFQWDVQSVETKAGDDSVALLALVHWRSPQYVDDAGTAVAIIEERTGITVHSRQLTYRLIDFDISLRALVGDVSIGGSDDSKGYGGFSPRIKLTPDQRFRSEAGELEPIRTAMDAGPWVDVADQQWGLTIIAHDQNPGTVGKWILRRRRSMQNAVYPGREPALVSEKTPTRLRYRLVVHDGTITPEQINQLHASWNAIP